MLLGMPVPCPVAKAPLPRRCYHGSPDEDPTPTSSGAPRREGGLKKWPTRVSPTRVGRAVPKRLAAGRAAELAAKTCCTRPTPRFPAHLPGMDAAAGRRHQTRDVRHQSSGCQVFSFKHPSAEELQHDFLWRTRVSCPNAGGSHLQPLLLREVLISARASGDPARRKPARRSQRPGLHLEAAVSLDSPGWKTICIATERASSSSSSIFRRRNSASASRAHRRAAQELEIQPRRRRGKKNTGSSNNEGLEACLAATSSRHVPWYVVPPTTSRNRPADRLGDHRGCRSRGSTCSYPEPDSRAGAQLQAIRRRLAK